MNWNEAFNNLTRMVDLKLPSISGRSDITILDVNDKQITVSTATGNHKRATSEIRKIIDRMDLLAPVHIDSVLLGSGSSRNQPETIIANMPDVEWLHLNNRKHIVWMGRQTHLVGTLKELDEFNSAQLRMRFKGQGPLAGRSSSKVIILAKNLRLANDFISALFQSNEPQALAGGRGYIISSDSVDLVLLPAASDASENFEVIPVVRVVDKSESLARILRVFPDAVYQEVNCDMNLGILRLPGGSALAVED